MEIYGGNQLAVSPTFRGATPCAVRMKLGARSIEKDIRYAKYRIDWITGSVHNFTFLCLCSIVHNAAKYATVMERLMITNAAFNFQRKATTLDDKRPLHKCSLKCGMKNDRDTTFSTNSIKKNDCRLNDQTVLLHDSCNCQLAINPVTGHRENRCGEKLTAIKSDCR
jgi:hypothetical protein